MHKKNPTVMKVYELLDDLKLLQHTSKLVENVKKLQLSHLESAYNELRAHYRYTFDSILDNLWHEADEFRIYPTAGRIEVPSYVSDGQKFYKVQAPLDESFLSAVCLYADKLIVYDPLFEVLTQLEQGVEVENLKLKLLRRLPTLLVLRELARHGILVLVPTVAYREDIIDKWCSRDSEDTTFRQICLQNMRLRRASGVVKGEYPYDYIVAEVGLGSPSMFVGALSPTLPAKTGFRFIDTGMQAPSRLDIMGLESEPGGVSFTMGAGGLGEGSVEMTPTVIPLSSMEQDDAIKAVVEDSIFRISRHLNTNLAAAQAFNASYITGFDVEWLLLERKLAASEGQLRDSGKAAKVIPSLVEMELAFLENIPYQKILKLREKEGNAFQQFRLALARACRNIEGSPAGGEFEKEAKAIVEEHILPELRRLNVDFDRIKKSSLLSGAIRSTAAVTIAAFSGLPPAAIAVTGVATALEKFAQYYREKAGLKQNSMYFLWRLCRI